MVYQYTCPVLTSQGHLLFTAGRLRRGGQRDSSRPLHLANTLYRWCAGDLIETGSHYGEQPRVVQNPTSSWRKCLFLKDRLLWFWAVLQYRH